jgi:hypothetical protein
MFICANVGLNCLGNNKLKEERKNQLKHLIETDLSRKYSDEKLLYMTTSPQEICIARVMFIYSGYVAKPKVALAISPILGSPIQVKSHVRL